MVDEKEIVENDEENASKDMYMSFKAGNEFYAIGIEYVNEIIGFQNITAIPETEDYIKGLINLRGKIIPVIDVRLRLKLTELEYTDRTCIIVIDVKNMVVGLIVEQIAEVITIGKDNILPPPSIGRNEKVQNNYVYGIGKVGESVKLLIDPDKLLNEEVINAVTATGEAAIVTDTQDQEGTV